MIRTLLIEDEPHARRELLRLLKEHPEVEVVGTVESVEEGLEYLATRTAPDLIISDIQLGDGLSFEIFERHRVTCPVIFTTAYDQYALQAFKVHAVDYLLKPVDPSALASALERFAAINRPLPDYSVLLRAFRGQPVQEYRERISGRLGDKIIHHPVQEVAYFQAGEDAVTMHPFQGPRAVIDLTLDRLEPQLDPRRFFRISRSLVVNINAVGRVEKYGNSQWAIQLTPALHGPVLVARSRSKAFLTWLDS